MMRRLLVASLLAAGLAGALAQSPHGDNLQIRRRKTIGFGPSNPNAVYRSAPSISINNFGIPVDPYATARLFINDITAGAVPLDSTFEIREDSYTDSRTGVTHIYARQYVAGVEVLNGDININIQDGKVISYGDSFYREGGKDINSPLAPSNIHSEYCAQLQQEIQSRREQQQQLLFRQGGQVVMGGKHAEGDLGELSTLYEWNCAHVEAPETLSEPDPYFFHNDGSGQALLRFMLTATPDAQLAEDIAGRPSEYLNKMTFAIEHGLHGAAPTFTIGNVPDAVSPVKATMAFIQNTADGVTSLDAVWKFEVEMEHNWYEAAVTVMPPFNIMSVVDWASDSPLPVPKEPSSAPSASYEVFAWGINDPESGNRTHEKENFDLLASPVGWHSLPYANDPSLPTEMRRKKGFRNTTDTWGNNVFAHENWEGRNAWIENFRPSAGGKLKFHYPYSPKETDNSADAMIEAKKHINATITQLFYTGNMIHDLYYRYGFDEIAGNFQSYNFERGGQEDDAVIMNAQDGSGFNNANFMTPPDGQNGRCRMYLWNTANPYRDGDLEAGIVIHEYSHGLSTRLTGGPANSGCLGWGESGGMGEGWGDFLATTIRSNRNYSDYAMGAWAANRVTGIRNYVYSTNETVNPSTYKTLDKPGYWGVHAIGEVWAELLWVVSQRLIVKHGFSDTLYPPKPEADGIVPEGDFYRPAEYDAHGKPKPLVPKHGNSLIFQLVLNGMKLQPCRPSFFDARDAIIAADQALTGGENFCDLWTGFAERGLGPDARVDGRTPWGGGVRTNDFSIPSACKGNDGPQKPLPKPTPAPGDGDEDDDGDDDFPWRR